METIGFRSNESAKKAAFEDMHSLQIKTRLIMQEAAILTVTDVTTDPCIRIGVLETIEQYYALS